MTETFLILLSGGILLAAAISNPKEVTLQWLRLCGILALALGALALFFFVRRERAPEIPAFFHRMEVGLSIAAIAAVLGQLAFVQVAWRGTQRAFAAAGFLLAVLAGSALLHDLMITRNTAVAFPPKLLSIGLQFLGCAGVAAMTGLVLMEMLLGHAYLTAAKMGIAPFKRLNRAMAVTLVLRTLSAVVLVLALQSWKPVYMLWGLYGLHALTRYFVGLCIPAIFTYMAYDCIKRRSTQSATGILYVSGLMVFIGELAALYLVRETGLPF